MSPELRFPLDPTNPGQFYASCGLVELFELFGAETLSWFELAANRPRTAEFVIAVGSPLDLDRVLSGIAEAQFEPITGDTEESIKPVRATINGGQVELDWWLDEFRLKANSLKCWAGQVTSLKLFQELSLLIEPGTPPEKLFAAAQPTKSKFGVDPRSAWNALDFGYSPNEQGQDVATFPAVEILAAFGLQSFRPSTTARDNMLYNLWDKPLPRLAACQLAANAWEDAPVSAFRFSIEKRGSYKFFTPAMPCEKDNYDS